MFLTQFILDPQSRQVQRELANRYELHRTLTAQFPALKREDIGLLYRLEMPEGYQYSAIKLLVQTRVEPCWDNLWHKGLLLEVPEVKAFDIPSTVGEMFYFRLVANPTVRRKQAAGEKGQRVGLYKSGEQEAWLKRKAEGAGFEVLALRLRDLGMIESRKQTSGRTYVIQHQAVQFEGGLQVSDPDRFRRTIIHGMGRAKAFGFGLLSLAK